MDILSEASEIVNNDRGRDYGHPADNDARIAQLWGPVLGIEVDPKLIPLLMILVKIAREVHYPKRDNRVDIAGYAQTLQMHYDREEEENEARVSHSPSK